MEINSSNNRKAMDEKSAERGEDSLSVGRYWSDVVSGLVLQNKTRLYSTPFSPATLSITAVWKRSLHETRKCSKGKARVVWK